MLRLCPNVALPQAQRAIRNQVQELDALRAHTLTKVMTEERSRYAKVMLAVLDALKTESNYFQRVRIAPPPSLHPRELSGFTSQQTWHR